MVKQEGGYYESQLKSDVSIEMDAKEILTTVGSRLY